MLDTVHVPQYSFESAEGRASTRHNATHRIPIERWGHPQELLDRVLRRVRVLSALSCLCCRCASRADHFCCRTCWAGMMEVCNADDDWAGSMATPGNLPLPAPLQAPVRARGQNDGECAAAAAAPPPIPLPPPPPPPPPPPLPPPRGSPPSAASPAASPVASPAAGRVNAPAAAAAVGAAADTVQGGGPPPPSPDEARATFLAGTGSTPIALAVEDLPLHPDEVEEPVQQVRSPPLPPRPSCGARTVQ